MNLTSGVELLAGLLGGLVLALGGLALEVFAFQRMLAGDVVTGIWLILFGAVVIYAGMSLLGRRPLIERSS